MSTPAGGQSGQGEEPDAGLEYGDRWWAVPSEVVLEFVAELCAEHTYRGVGKMVDLSKETVRKYVERIAKPHRSTQKRFAELYLARHRGGSYGERVRTEARRWPGVAAQDRAASG